MEHHVSQTGPEFPQAHQSGQEVSAFVEGAMEIVADALAKRVDANLGTKAEAPSLSIQDVLSGSVDPTMQIFSRTVRVDRTRSRLAMINATSKDVRDINPFALASAPGDGESIEEVDVHFFYMGNRFLTDAELNEMCRLRNLKVADPYVQAAVVEDDPSFPERYQLLTYWRDEEDNLSYCEFGPIRLDESELFARQGVRLKCDKTKFTQCYIVCVAL